MLDFLFKTALDSSSSVSSPNFFGSDDLSPSSSKTLTPPSSLEECIEVDRRYEGRTLSISKKTDNEVINKIFEGNTKQIDEIFFPKKENDETRLMREIIKAVIFNPTKFSTTKGLLNPGNLFFIVDPKNTQDTQVVFNGLKYSLYALLDKVKWDLIVLDKAEIAQYYSTIKNHDYRYLGYLKEMGVPKCHDMKKAYLYENLEDAEKIAIEIYKSYGGSLNSFLRGVDCLFQEGESLCYYENAIRELIAHIAVLSNALNKIPPSVDEYLYRCMSDVELKGGVSLIGSMTQKMKDSDKFKEKGFTSTSLYKPRKGFLGHGEVSSAVKIYKNPKMLAKDISALGGYKEEFECLMLPNAKDQVLREVTFRNLDDLSLNETTHKTHIYFTKLISKRRGVV